MDTQMQEDWASGRNKTKQTRMSPVFLDACALPITMLHALPRNTIVLSILRMFPDHRQMPAKSRDG
jgi:hypothetical protein